MNKVNKKLTILGTAIALLFGLNACNTESNEPAGPVIDPGDVVISDDQEHIIPGQYIVVFKNEYIPSGRSTSPVFNDRAAKREFSAQRAAIVNKEIDVFLTSQGINSNRVIARYESVFSGFAAKLTEAEVTALEQNDKIERVEPDRMVYLEGTGKVVDMDLSGPVASRQEDFLPCGVTLAGGVADGSSKNTWIWIVDSGIDLDHEDLNVQTSSSYARSFVGGSADDCNGHGTHVAGTAAAIDNGFGVVGVSAGATVVPVRVFGCSGGSPTSTIVSGINHVAANDISGDVMNLSLGGFFGSGCSSGSSYRTAVQNVANGGTHVAIAAGNSADNAAFYQPACINGTRIYTVAAMDCNQNFASSYSNFGIGPVDWIATGTQVGSTYPNNRYVYNTGTSMACPHVAGILHQRNGAPRNGGTVSFGGSNYKIAIR